MRGGKAGNYEGNELKWCQVQVGKKKRKEKKRKEKKRKEKRVVYTSLMYLETFIGTVAFCFPAVYLRE